MMVVRQKWFSCRIALLWALLGAVLLAVVVWGVVSTYNRPMSNGTGAAAIHFYGRVQDQDGQPMAGAEVVVRTSELVPNQWTSGGTISDTATAKSFSVFTGAQGSFVLTLPPDHNELRIEAIRKPGYELVTDWAWQVPPDERNNNMYFRFPGRYWQRAVYFPDPQRPAVLLLHLKDSAKPLGKMSRGGSDLGQGEVITRNDPYTPKIPSTGPGAPRTNKEIEDAIGALFEERNRQKR